LWGRKSCQKSVSVLRIGNIFNLQSVFYHKGGKS